MVFSCESKATAMSLYLFLLHLRYVDLRIVLLVLQPSIQVFMCI